MRDVTRRPIIIARREQGRWGAVDVIKYAMFCAAAVAVVTACDGGGSHDAALTGQSVAPIASTESAPPCSSATADVLKSATQRLWQDSSVQFTVAKVLCSADWAIARIQITPDDHTTNPPNTVLFHHDDGSWRAVQYGSGFQCTGEGVPPSIAVELEC